METSVGIVVTLLLFEFTLQTCGESEPEFSVSQGVIFRKAGTMVNAEKTWTLVVKMDSKSFEKLETQARELQMEVKKLGDEALKQAKVASSGTSPTIGIRRLFDVWTNESRLITESLRRVMQIFQNRNDRKKRSLIPLLGKVSRLLFGTIDEESFDKTQRKIGAISHSVKNLLTVSEAHEEGILRIEDSLNHAIQSIIILQNQTETQLRQIMLSQQEHETAQMNIQFALHAAAGITTQEKTQLQATEISILTMISRRLSTQLINPEKLQEILMYIEKSLPNGDSLVLNGGQENLLWYYTMLETEVLIENGQLYAIADIPLESVKRIYDLFTVQSLPIRMPGSNVSFQIQVEATYLAIEKEEVF